MKTYFKILVFIAFILNFSFSKAQEKNNYLRLEMGRSFTGSGDLSGNGVGLEYSRQLTKADRLSAGISVLNFSFVDDALPFISEQNNWAHGIEMTYYRSFLNTKKIQPEIGLGFYTRYWSWYQKFQDYPDPVVTKITSKYSSIGYTFSLGVNFKLAKKTCLNLRGNLQNDNNADIVWNGRLGIGFLF